MSKHNGKITPDAKPDRELPEVCGGDGENYWYFYSGCGYENNSSDNIAAFAKENLDYFKDMSVEDIRDNHIYWGTDGPRFHGLYNGDTNVLFGDPDKLPEAQREDAYANVKSLREAQKQKAEERSAAVDPAYDSYRDHIKSTANAYENLSQEQAAGMSDERLCALYDAAMIQKDLDDELEV